MKAKGKTLPANTGPVPSTNRVSAGNRVCGRTTRMATASVRIVPILRNVER